MSDVLTMLSTSKVEYRVQSAEDRIRLGLPTDDLAVPVVPASTSSRYVPQLCLDALEGVHPEDIAALAVHFRGGR